MLIFLIYWVSVYVALLKPKAYIVPWSNVGSGHKIRPRSFFGSMAMFSPWIILGCGVLFNSIGHYCALWLSLSLRVQLRPWGPVCALGPILTLGQFIAQGSFSPLGNFWAQGHFFAPLPFLGHVATLKHWGRFCALGPTAGPRAKFSLCAILTRWPF